MNSLVLSLPAASFSTPTVVAGLYRSSGCMKPHFWLGLPYDFDSEARFTHDLAKNRVSPCPKAAEDDESDSGI